MAKSLVVVESPAKAKTINKYLGRNFTVKASLGHIRDLPERKLGVNIKGGFKPQYVTIKDKAKVIKEIREAALSADKVYLAADPDREGEAICWHLKQVLGKINKPIYRITFNEITERAIKEALKNPGNINLNLVNAQQARRVLDRLVGYQISPILWKSVRKGLSAGRVQSVALRLVCEREEERERFQPQEYWVITAKLVGEEGKPFLARLVAIGERKAEVEGKGFLMNEEEAKSVAESLRGLTFQVESVKRQTRLQKPLPPFITSKLQQEANRRFKFPARKTMSIAQQLYEGVELGSEGPVGLITYIRTDSTRVAEEAIAAVRDHIRAIYGPDYLPSKPNLYKSKKGAQEAHEAIRPTYLDRTPESVKSHLTPDQYRLYNLIWRRFVASQMKPARFQLTTVNISASQYQLRATGSVILFDGFLRAYRNGERDEEETLPELKEGERLELLEIKPEQFFTQPPPRYTEASLIKELEEKGIGRPSTYATIMSTLLDRKYVVKEKGYLVPTEVGVLVNRLLVKSFPEIMDVGFTANMEDKLDEIEDGRADWVEVLKEFYSNFRKYLQTAPDKIYQAKKEMEEETDEICEKCGRKMVIKWGRYGKFLACSGYPECTNSRPIKEEKKEIVTDQICDLCGSPMVVKLGRRGRFLACSAYPDCRNTKPIGTGIKCPKCGGELVEKSSKKGRVFYGCDNYPQCDYAIWDKPVDKPCPRCGSSFLVEKKSKGKTYLACPNEGCDYVER
jgi:DNA topoisomerase-1